MSFLSPHIHADQGQARGFSPLPAWMDSHSTTSGNDHDFNLTLPPINPFQPFDNDFELPSFNSSYMSRPSSPLRFSNNQAPSSSHLNSINYAPPSNRQAGDESRQDDFFSHYEYGYGAESPDPFDEFGTDLRTSRASLTPLPAEMAPSRTSKAPTRASSVVDLTESSPTLPAKKRKREDNSSAEGRINKSKREARSSVEVVDLENVETQKEYEEFKAKQQADAIRLQNEEEANKPLKLAEFQCIICMDNPTDLTVTHCGHLFCSECLHSALNAGDKKSCPVCRTLISMGKPGGKPPKNGIFPLEMKLMTSNKKGKQPARVR